MTASLHTKHQLNVPVQELADFIVGKYGGPPRGVRANLSIVGETAILTWTEERPVPPLPAQGPRGE